MPNISLASEAIPPQMDSKRYFDIICSLLAMPFLAIITLIVAIGMKFVCPGPVFFLQERVGHLGRRFKIYKFRTMSVSADTTVHQQYFSELVKSDAPMVKMDARGDSRLVPGGWLLRASGLDELPQLINVIKGDMSLVGPRPCLPAEYDQYTPAQRRRFEAAPGLTGLWQVSGKNRTTFTEMIKLDVQYAETKSFWLDLNIILITPFALIQQILDTRAGRRILVQDDRMTEIPFPARQTTTKRNN